LVNDPERRYALSEASKGYIGDKFRSQLLEIHRNGFIHYMKDYGSFNDKLQLKILWDYGLAVDLLQTIQFLV